MKPAVPILCLALLTLTGCNTMLRDQLAELEAARDSGRITEAQYLDLKQRAQQAAAHRRAVILAAPDK